MSLTEQQSHYALWSIMASPLLIGSDVTLITNDSLRIMGNSEVNAVNQDAKGVQGVPTNADSSCWTKPLADGAVAALLLNPGGTAANITCTWAELNVKAGSATVRDLWAKRDWAAPQTGEITVELASHAQAMVKITSR